jgi:hypothetical protein
MSLKTRLALLERSSRWSPDRPRARPTLRDWLDIWEAKAAGGYFDAEPDFATAIACYRDEVEAADPGATASNWMASPSWDWLSEMDMRIRHGLLPVTISEYLVLADWYHRHETVLYDINLRVFLADATPRGARRDGVTQVVRRLRRLRSEHPELI